MKRLLFSILVLFLCSLTIFGQNLRFGLTATPQVGFPRILAGNVTNAGVKLGLSYGLLIDFSIDNNERYAFSTGFLHTITGLNLDVDIKNAAGDSIIRTDSRNLKIQYIEIPLTIRLRTNEIGYITYYGQFGFVPGINVSSRMDQESTEPGDEYNFTNKKIKEIGFANLALHIGIGMEYSVSSSTQLLGGIYYSNGFTNVYNPKDIGDKISLRQIGLRLGVLF